MSPKSAAFKPTLQKSPPFSVEVPDRPHIEGETIPRRHPSCVDALKSQPEEGVATLFDALLLSSEKFRELKAVGTRKMIKKHNEVEKEKKTVDGKEEEVDKNWTYFEMGPYEYLTFGEYMTLTTQIGAGYRKLGLGREDRVHIFAATR
jgi:long-chain acyl-CoA synthetase